MDNYNKDLNKNQKDFMDALLMIDQINAKNILLSFLKNDNPLDSVESLIVPVLSKIGKGWDVGEYSLSQVYMAGRICENIVDEILPPTSPKRINQPKMVIATLEDYHLLGKKVG